MIYTENELDTLLASLGELVIIENTVTPDVL